MASEALPASSPRFFVLKKQNSGRYDIEFSKAEPVLRGPPLACPRCGEPIGMLTWLPPYRARLEHHGQDYGDLAEGPGNEFLITERFASAFQEEGLTGFSGFHPVEIVKVRRQRRGHKPTPPPPYLVVTPLRGGAVVDEARSRILRTRPITCTLCRATGIDAMDGFSLEAGSWTGADVFYAYGAGGTLIVSERFVRFAQTRAMDHMAMIPTEKYVWDPLRRYYPDGPPKDVRA